MTDVSVMPTGAPPTAPDAIGRALPRAWACAALFDLLFLLDSALRWRQGFGFVGVEWLSNVIPLLLVVLAFGRFLALERLPTWLVTLGYLPLLSVFFCAIGSGTPFHWLEAPLIGFSPDAHDDWTSILLQQGGLWTAAIGTVVHVIWFATARHVVRTRPAHFRELMDLGLGAGWVLAATMRFTPLVWVRDPMGNVHDGQPAIVALVATVRTCVWALVFLIGLFLFARGFRRRFLRGYGHIE